MNKLRQKLEVWEMILAASPKGQLCLVLAGLLPVGIMLVGTYFTDHISFAPPYGALSGPIREAILHRYLEAALVSFFGFLGAAGSQLAKTRRRLCEGH